MLERRVRTQRERLGELLGKRPKARGLFGRRVHSDSVPRAAERFHRFLPKKNPPVIVDDEPGSPERG